MATDNSIVRSALCSFLFFSLCGAASADVLHVPKQFDTIQLAINAAAPGDTVLVHSGVYTGSFVVNAKNNITLRAPGRVILHPPVATAGITVQSSSNIIIDGFTIKQCDVDAVRLTGVTASTIQRCTIIEPAGDGIRADDCQQLIIRKNVVKRPGGHALSLGVESGLETSGCSVEKNIFFHGGVDGISVLGDQNAIGANIIKEAQEDGIELAAGSGGNSIEKNTIKNSLSAGIKVGGNGNAIVKNLVSAPGTAGLEVSGDNNSFEKVVIHQSHNDGVRILSGGEHNTFEQVYVTNSGGDGFHVAGDNNTFQKNRSTIAGDNGFDMSSVGNTLTNNRAVSSGSFDLFDPAPIGSNNYSGNKFPKKGP